MLDDVHNPILVKATMTTMKVTTSYRKLSKLASKKPLEQLDELLLQILTRTSLRGSLESPNRLTRKPNVRGPKEQLQSQRRRLAVWPLFNEKVKLNKQGLRSVSVKRVRLMQSLKGFCEKVLQRPSDRRLNENRLHEKKEIE